MHVKLTDDLFILTRFYLLIAMISSGGATMGIKGAIAPLIFFLLIFFILEF